MLYGGQVIDMNFDLYLEDEAHGFSYWLFSILPKKKNLGECSRKTWIKFIYLFLMLMEALSGIMGRLM